MARKTFYLLNCVLSSSLKMCLDFNEMKWKQIEYRTLRDEKEKERAVQKSRDWKTKKIVNSMKTLKLEPHNNNDRIRQFSGYFIAIFLMWMRVSEKWMICKSLFRECVCVCAFDCVLLSVVSYFVLDCIRNFCEMKKSFRTCVCLSTVCACVCVSALLHVYIHVSVCLCHCLCE